ncbi:MAG TPA: hypothetical protein VGJ81_01980 [Thermoanaerobaculia bacterium]|jgi:TRAP-type C4-dicarboxylate transport system permease small subunit
MRRTTDVLIAIFAFAFIIILAVAAYWDPAIRVLHAFEALPYLVAAILCLRRIPFGYPIGAVAGGFWLWTATFLTSFVPLRSSVRARNRTRVTPSRPRSHGVEASLSRSRL